jgi:hypothetical protein
VGCLVDLVCGYEYGRFRCRPRVGADRWASGEASMSIGSARRDVEDRGGPSIPGPRTAADAYRVSDDQIHRARLVVARNCDDPDDLRQLLDMLGLISPHPDQPPPVGR